MRNLLAWSPQRVARSEQAISRGKCACLACRHVMQTFPFVNFSPNTRELTAALHCSVAGQKPLQQKKKAARCLKCRHSRTRRTTTRTWTLAPDTPDTSVARTQRKPRLQPFLASFRPLPGSRLLSFPYGDACSFFLGRKSLLYTASSVRSYSVSQIAVARKVIIRKRLRTFVSGCAKSHW